jgi:hypothetical protein|eukprot:3263142-Prymnesium_polylepis.1
MTTLTLIIPVNRDVKWITEISPETLCDLLDGLEVIYTTSSPDTAEMQKEHYQSLLHLKEEHTKEMDALKETLTAERERSEERLAQERDAYSQKIESFVRGEIERQLSHHQPNSDLEAELTATLTTILGRHYEEKGRFPRTIADILPQLKEEQRTALLNNTPLYDSVIAQIKSEHYRNKRAKTDA